MRIPICVLIACLLLNILTGSSVSMEKPSLRRVTLAEPALAATEGGRMRLKYLASCALDAGAVLVAEAAGRSYEFPGGLGLAPQWLKRSLTPEEERWISACIFARTNYFGVPVQISLRSPFPTEAPGLQLVDGEAQDFPLEEATFFGNVFRQDAVGYVCGNNDSDERKDRIAAHKRLCALPLHQKVNDRSITACNMVYIGACTPEGFIQDGMTYREAVTVFLPAAPR